CLTLCIVLFTDKNRNGNVKETSGTIADNSAENSGDITADNNESETTKHLEDTGNSGSKSDRDQVTTKESSNYKETTTKIIESQVSADTPPVTYKNTENENQTTSAETTSVGIPFSGTTAVINSSCNIRSSADVRGNVIGTANAGTSYRIDPAKCNSDWIAIYLDDTTIGYISTIFCSVN
ncbi:MAG: SH3 domain-containing protein, partial [Lachnospiraceae bacterium]|nr:SH3 domain-containing protein [Lachnospiraceae bacterium]